MSSKHLAIALASLLMAVGGARARTARPDAIAADGVPPIPSALADALRPYDETRAAFALDWNVGDRSLLITTRFANTVAVAAAAAAATAARTGDQPVKEQAEQPQLSQEAAALIAPVHEAYVRVEKEQATLPPPKDDRERLERLLEVDQAGRTALSHIDFTKLPPEQSRLAWDTAFREIMRHDLADQAVMKAMTPAHGWFTKSKYGDKAVEGAFLIVQHAGNDKAWMKDVLARIEPLVKIGEVPPGYYALLYDRTALFDNRKQRYGTQMICKDKKYVPADMEDRANVDVRRKQLGMKTTEEDYLKDFADDPPCIPHPVP